MVKPLTISIVTYNSQPYIADCLASLKEQSYQDFDLIVVDNNSEDDTRDTAKLIFPEARIIHLASNKGFGSAHNMAIRTCDSPWVLVLNPDTKLDKDCLKNMMLVTENDSIGSVGNCLLRAKGEGQAIVDSAGIKRTFYNEVIDRGSGNELSIQLKQSQEVWGISGACAMYRRQALEEVAHKTKMQPEYFDEHFFMYKEDIDLAARLQRHGWKAWYEASAIGYHDRTGNAEATFVKTVHSRKNKPSYIHTNSYRNHWYFLLKNAKPHQIVPSLIYELAKAFYLLFFEPQTLKSIPVIIKNIPTMVSRRYA